VANPTDILIRKVYEDEIDKMVRGTLSGSRAFPGQSFSVKDRVSERLNLSAQRVEDGVARTVRNGS